jgi:photosystem II stability/assembly factor-like uncharacterized protein
MIKRAFAVFLFLFFISASTFAQYIEVLQQGRSTSIRGLSVVDNHVAWISGSKGTIAITTDGGETWNWQQVKGFEKSDFRDIEAFSDKEAIIISSGTPALILKTTDGGASWQEKYKNTDTACFFDAMDFAGKQHGYVLGDPIGGKFLLMETNDGGETWAPFENPPEALPGEAAFAASGTCLRVQDGTIYIATGGKSARLIRYSPFTNKWSYSEVPLLQGASSQGAFSLALAKRQIMVVGGDYQKDKIDDAIAAFLVARATTEINASMFSKIKKGPAGFQSCVEYISDNTFLSTGTPGSNITTDGGKTWTKIDDASYNVCRKAKKGKLVLLAGNDGKIGILKM